MNSCDTCRHTAPNFDGLINQCGDWYCPIRLELRRRAAADSDDHPVAAERDDPPRFDNVERARHYNVHPSGIEAITIAEHMNFCLGNVIKYLLRADFKSDAIEDLRKARYYLDREIALREKAKSA